jgi:hypothetical protein
MEIELVCLANSKKLGARCIAGKEWSTPEHSWIRPVSDVEHGAVPESACQLRGTSPQRGLRPLDIVRVELQGMPSPQEHPEDRLLGPSAWVHVGTIDPDQLSSFVDSPDTIIPMDPDASRTDHLGSAYVLAHPLRRSLWLIEVPALKLVWKEGNDGPKWYAEFWYRNTTYRLKVTDTFFLDLLEQQGTLREGARPERHLCISIGVYYAKMEAYYKLVAAVLP